MYVNVFELLVLPLVLFFLSTSAHVICLFWQMCAVLFPLWVAWMLLGYAQLRPLLPVCVLLQVANVAFYLALPLWMFSDGRKEQTGIQFPAVVFYALQTFIIAAYIFFRGKGLQYAVGYILLVALAAVVRLLHSSYIFDEYVRSEADKILVVLVYQPLTSIGLLSMTRLITMKLIDLTPEEAPDSSKWYTVYAALHLIMQVTGR